MLRYTADTPWDYGDLVMEPLEQTADTREYVVQGMTCDHCVLSVREEVSEVPGVSAVDVDLASGRMLVSGARVDDAAVRAAVVEAGYEVAS
jgi:copper chaperone CopZ